MITSNQFLHSLMTMTEDEMSTYLTNLNSWLTTKMPQIQFKSTWTDSDAAIFDEGLILLSAFIRAQDYCLAAYNFSTTEKRIKNFFYYVTNIKSFLQGQNILPKETTSGARSSVSASADATIIGASFIPPIRTGKTGRPTKPRNIPEIRSAGAKDTLLRSKDDDDPLRQTIDARPRHLHDYIHLLPEDLQQEALSIPDLYDQLADEAHKLETLCTPVLAPSSAPVSSASSLTSPSSAPVSEASASARITSTQKDRAYHAARLCNIEDKLRSLWARIDVAYAEATGSTVSSDYKHYLETEHHRINSELRPKELCEYTKFDIDNMPEGEQKELTKQARIDRDKKFLRKDDRQQSDTHRQNLIDAATELHAWGIAITDSQAACCLKYGYEVPADWIELPLAERKKQQAEARNAKRREERAIKRAERQAKKQAEIDELKRTYTTGDLSVFGPTAPHPDPLP